MWVLTRVRWRFELAEVLGCWSRRPTEQQLGAVVDEDAGVVGAIFLCQATGGEAGMYDLVETLEREE
jgi:hypothetical protein